MAEIDTCPTCGEDPESVYRCEHCGKDLVGNTERDERNVRSDGGLRLDEYSTHDLVMIALDELDDHDRPNGAPTQEIVDWVVGHCAVSEGDVYDALDWLHSRGEVYRPAGEHYRRTDPEDQRWSQ